MATFRVQVSVELRTGSESVMAYEIEAEKPGFATIEGRRRAKADAAVKRVTQVTWEILRNAA